MQFTIVHCVEIANTLSVMIMYILSIYQKTGKVIAIVLKDFWYVCKLNAKLPTNVSHDWQQISTVIFTCFSWQ